MRRTSLSHSSCPAKAGHPVNTKRADGAPLEVEQGHPAGADPPEGTPTQAGFSPDYAPEEIFDIAKRLMKNM